MDGARRRWRVVAMGGLVFKERGCLGEGAKGRQGGVLAGLLKSTAGGGVGLLEGDGIAGRGGPEAGLRPSQALKHFF